jgi:hypothetical protein
VREGLGRPSRKSPRSVGSVFLVPARAGADPGVRCAEGLRIGVLVEGLRGVVVLEGFRLVGVDGDGSGSCSGGLALGEEAMVCELRALERYFIRILSRNWKVDGELKLLSHVYQLTTSTTLPQQQSAQRVRRNPPENRREDNAIMSTSTCCIEFAVEAPAGMNK